MTWLPTLPGLYPKDYDCMKFFFSIKMGKSRAEERCACSHPAWRNSCAEIFPLNITVSFAVNPTVKLFCWLCFHSKNAMAPTPAVANMLIRAPFQRLLSNVAVTSLVLVSNLDTFSSDSCKNAFTCRWNTYARLAFSCYKCHTIWTTQTCCQSP